jgi:uncharacterized protein YaiL (DUF2058 family)
MAGSLTDQLLKLGLVDDKTVRKAQHTQRQSNKKLGKAGVEVERQQRHESAEKRRHDARSTDKERELLRQGQVNVREGQQQIEQIIETGRVAGRVTGRRRFYYESLDGRVPYVEVSDEAINDLQNGRIAFVEQADGRVTFITREAAERIHALDRQRLTLWNG